MINKLILTWRNPENRAWTPVANLEYKKSKYYFNYLQGAKVKNFRPFDEMSDLTKTYSSEELFPIFKNRLLSKSRPEYEDFLRWLDIDKNDRNDLLELAMSRGIRATDELQLFPIPDKNDDGNYEVLFFSHGISHISKSYIQRLEKLGQDDRLLILKDVQNDADPHALMMRTKDDPAELVGYCPAFFVKDFNTLMELNGNNSIVVTVQKVNTDAPLQLKLLCRLTTKWHSSFEPFSSPEFQPITT